MKQENISDPHRARQDFPIPDLAAIETYIGVVVSDQVGTFALRIFLEKGDPRGLDEKLAKKFTRLPFLTTGLDLAKEVLGHAQTAARDRLAIFCIPGITRGHGHAKAEDIVSIQTICADIDNGDIEAKREHLVKWLGPPTLEVESGGLTREGQDKLHLHWRLIRPSGRAELAEVARIRHVIALKIGDDPSFQKISQPIRVAGSVHNKRPAKLVEIRKHRDLKYELSDLARLVAEIPVMTPRRLKPTTTK